jgi:hypothetical protein
MKFEDIIDKNTPSDFAENDERTDFQFLKTKLGAFNFDGMDNWTNNQKGWFGDDANTAEIWKGQAKVLPY